MPTIIVPFTPFGVWELRLPIAWDANNLVKQLNGITDGQLTAGKNLQGRKFYNQQEHRHFHQQLILFLPKTQNLPTQY